MFLYTITNTLDGKKYVGITNNVSRRWKEHRTDLKGERHGNPHLQAAWHLYGERVFSFNVVEKFKVLDDLYKAEIRYISDYNLLDQSCGYNMSIGGIGSFVHTEDARTRISKAQEKSVISMCLKTGQIKKYGRILDVEKDGLSPRSIANPCSDRALTYRGRVWMYLEDYTKDPNKLLEKKESRQNVKARPSRYRAVIGTCLNTGRVVLYDACYHAQKDGFINSHIRQCCLGIRKTHKGFSWKFKD